MNLNDFIKNLLELQARGLGELYVYSQHSASGTVEELGHAYLATADKEGPYDLERGAPFIRIVAGN